jgi:PAS domain S-box-containing protein
MRKVQVQPPADPVDEGVLQTILEGTGAGAGEGLFKALAQNLARALQAHGAWVTEYLPESRRLRALAFFINGEWIEGHEFGVDGTPCGAVIENAAFIHFPDRLAEQFPNDPHVKNAGAVGYMGVPLLGTDGAVLGHLAVIDRRPMPKVPRTLAIVRIFAARAAADLRRLRAERAAVEHEEKCRRLVDCALDAVVEVDAQLRLAHVNAAAAKLFGCTAIAAVGPDLARFLSDAGRETLRRMIRDLDSLPADRRDLSVAGAVEAKRADGHAFAAEATAFRSDAGRKTGYTVFLRDAGERHENERKVRGATAEAERLREFLRAQQLGEDILGRSEPMQAAMRVVQRAAETDGPVLIQGEIGTGKALFAKAIHARGRRRDLPFVRVNCAEVPPAQVEAELFGAAAAPPGVRDGFVALAEGGSIYLEEVAALPAPAQARLMRLLQDGEVDVPGAPRGRKADVRVLASTSQDLERAVAEGRFRRDLCDKLYAFALRLPPLRERPGDVALLAGHFVQKAARRIGRSVQGLGPADLERLAGQAWPGNVSELRGVIERAVMNAPEGRIDLDLVLPTVPAAPAPAEAPRVLTAEEIERMEHDNLLRALEAAGGQVTGESGAARLLGLKPATVTARMKALGIAAPGAARTRRSAPARARQPATRSRRR